MPSPSRTVNSYKEKNKWEGDLVIHPLVPIQKVCCTSYYWHSVRNSTGFLMLDVGDTFMCVWTCIPILFINKNSLKTLLRNLSSNQLSLSFSTKCTLIRCLSALPSGLPNHFHSRMCIKMIRKWASYHNDDFRNRALGLASDAPTQLNSLTPLSL